jgi:hypothetical protein
MKNPLKKPLASPDAGFAVDVLRSRHAKVRRLGKKLRRLDPRSSMSCASVSRSYAMLWILRRSMAQAASPALPFSTENAAAGTRYRVRQE